VGLLFSFTLDSYGSNLSHELASLTYIGTNEDKMEKRQFGKTDMLVSALGVGSYNTMNGSTVEEVRRLLDQALDAGVNVIDTAECYGLSEELIGQAVGHRRRDYYLFTKCGHAAGLSLPDWSSHLLEKSIERSLQRLRTDYLDLVQLHSCSQELLRRGEVIEALQRAREAGKTRYIGYSGDRRAALNAVKSGAFDALQTSVNIADQEAIELTLPHARVRRMGIIAKRSLANMAWKAQQKPADSSTIQTYAKRLATLKYDFLTGDLEEEVSTALRFTLSIPGVDIALVGSANLEHWQHNATMMAAGPLPQAQFEAICRRWRALTWWRRGLPGGRLGWRGWV
jgi:aryl-alcohol dehydrogenase-like predicted oxidoreductase